VLVEVLSPSTEDYDRGEKLGHYKTIGSLDEVVFVADDRREVEIVRRERDGSWSRHVSATASARAWRRSRATSRSRMCTAIRFPRRGAGVARGDDAAPTCLRER
jgi:hypothetical protein